MLLKSKTKKNYDLVENTCDLKLERITLLLELMGNPHKQLKYIHVAGTNGKGSTCAFIESVLMESGFKTGLFSSPHIVDARERIKINSEMISEQDLNRIKSNIQPFLEKLSSQGKTITEFELAAALAFQYFYEQKCDVIVLETGLGGRLDATNVVNPIVSVITSISVDHVDYLGSSIKQIAFEKAGIIKNNVPVVVSHQQQRETMNIINSIAFVRKSSVAVPDVMALRILESNQFGTSFIYKNIKFKISLLGRHQVNNAITAFEVINILINRGFNISIENISKGFSNVRLPARIEVLNYNPQVIVDGAHNIDAIKKLSDYINKNIRSKKLIGIMGILADKDVDRIVRFIVPKFDKIITVTPNNKRALDSDKLSEKVREFCNKVESLKKDYMGAIVKALRGNYKDLSVIMFGSFYLVADLRPLAINVLKNLNF